MKLTKKLSFAALMLCGVMLFAVGCGNTNYEDDVKDTDKDFSTLVTAAAQEKAYDYKFNFLPEIDGTVQGYVGDTMPYYEDGTYYVYYLKDRGDSYNHSVYLTTTKDFIHWEEKQECVLEADHGSAQDAMIGTGSVVKVKGTYYFFYTGHNGSSDPQETIMVAEGTMPTAFTKKAGWEIRPEASLSKVDFRDPQAYYDEAQNAITLTVTTQAESEACIVKYTLDGDSLTHTYDGIIHRKNTSVITGGDVWNLECSDTFKFGDKWYLTYSAQNDDVYYTSADTQDGPYTEPPKPLDGQLFYAAKHASDGTNTYMIGWSRRSDTVSSTTDVKGWGGNLQVQKVVSDGAGGIKLAPVDAYTQNTEERVLVAGPSVDVSSGEYTEAFRCFERYMVTGKFTYGGAGTFGFAFNYNNRKEKYKRITIAPKENKIALDFNLGETPITSIPASIEANKAYSFTYIQEGSIGVLYVDGQAAFTVRLYGVSGKNVMLWADKGSVSFTDLKQYTYTY